MKLVNKGKALYHCRVCLCKNVQLNRAYGHWPTEQFKRLSDTEQADFMKEVGKATNQPDVACLAQHKLERYEMHAKYYQNGGEFLPLGVWQTRGFDINNPSNTCDENKRILSVTKGKLGKSIRL